MATAPLGAESARANPLVFTLAPGMAPAAPIMRMLARFDRPKVEAFAEISIALLDLMDGDSDQEDATDLEDDWTFSAQATGYLAGPGCPIADAGGQCDEDGINTAMGAYWQHGLSFAGPGCPISDPDIEHDGREEQHEGF